MLNKFFSNDKVVTSLAREAAVLKMEAAKFKRDSYMFGCLANQFKLRPSFQSPVRFGKVDDIWICEYDDGQEEPEEFDLEVGSLKGFGTTPEEAAIHFDLIWFGIEQNFTEGEDED